MRQEDRVQQSSRYLNDYSPRRSFGTKLKPGAVIRAKPFSQYGSILFSTEFPLRAQEATGCILKFLDCLSLLARALKNDAVAQFESDFNESRNQGRNGKRLAGWHSPATSDSQCAALRLPEMRSLFMRRLTE
jgi:hypothetical protein